MLTQKRRPCLFGLCSQIEHVNLLAVREHHKPGVTPEPAQAAGDVLPSERKLRPDAWRSCQVEMLRDVGDVSAESERFGLCEELV